MVEKTTNGLHDRKLKIGSRELH